MAQVPNLLRFGGIHPRTVLRERRIPFNDDPNRWSNQTRKAEELTPYVAAGIARPWGMMKDDPTCVVVALKSRLLWREGTAFMGDWSSRNEIRGIDDVRSRCDITDFDAMFDNPNSNFPAPLPGEVLILGSIDLDEISGIYVRSAEHSVRLIAMVDAGDWTYDGPAIDVTIAPWIFGH
jgi:hypothetical protein